jgi:hypothetical protein
LILYEVSKPKIGASSPRGPTGGKGVLSGSSAARDSIALMRIEGALDQSLQRANSQLKKTVNVCFRSPSCFRFETGMTELSESMSGRDDLRYRSLEARTQTGTAQQKSRASF